MNENTPINRYVVSKQEDKINMNENKEASDFASVFPKWDLMPPTIVIKRIRRKA